MTRKYSKNTTGEGNGRGKRLKRRTAILATGSLIATTTAGCQELIPDESAPPVEELEIAYEGIRPPDPGLTNATMTIILEFSNPTNQEIPSPEFEYDLYINDVKAGDSRLAMATLPPQESVTETVEAVLDYVDMGAGIKRAIDEGKLDVRLEGLLRSEEATKETTLRETIFW